MSWLRLTELATGRDRLLLGPGGYVKRLATDSSVNGGFVSAWKVFRSYHIDKLHWQVYWGTQCSDFDGPKMPPDYIGGEDIGTSYPADCGQAYNDRLASSNSVQVQGRHNAPGYHHYRLLLLLLGLMILWLTLLLTLHQLATAPVVSPLLWFARSYHQLEWRCVRELQSDPSWLRTWVS